MNVILFLQKYTHPMRFIKTVKLTNNGKRKIMKKAVKSCKQQSIVYQIYRNQKKNTLTLKKIHF